jgi:hypothetical protein
MDGVTHIIITGLAKICLSLLIVVSVVLVDNVPTALTADIIPVPAMFTEFNIVIAVVLGDVIAAFLTVIIMPIGAGFADGFVGVCDIHRVSLWDIHPAMTTGGKVFVTATIAIIVTIVFKWAIVFREFKQGMTIIT